MLLPDVLTLNGIALGIISSGFGFLSGANHLSLVATLFAVLWAAAAAALVLLIRWSYWLVRRREGMGLGDAKLLALIAAWLGPGPTLLSLFLGVLLAATCGVALAAIQRSRSASFAVLRIPLGAFLCAAAIFSLFAGGPILSWYLRFFR